MKKTISNIFMEFLVFAFILLLLFCSNDCTALASNGLLIWFENMIPSLFPFMILSGFMIRSGLAEKLGTLLQPFLGILFRLPSPMLYVIFMGFLCGFPMGAKIIADMLEKKQITKKEGEFLLAFCNNIGPLYMLGYVIPLFDLKKTFRIFLLMYGVPLGYGIFLRYFSSYRQEFSHNLPLKHSYFIPQMHTLKLPFKNTKKTAAPLLHATVSTNYSTALYQSFTNAIEQITLLGGCMIFFNCLQIFPLLLHKYLIYFPGNFLHKTFIQGILCSLLEIGGGLSFFASHENALLILAMPFFIPVSIALLTFGGFSCLFQAYLILKPTGLSIRSYILHKLFQSVLIIVIFYMF